MFATDISPVYSIKNMNAMENLNQKASAKLNQKKKLFIIF